MGGGRRACVFVFVILVNLQLISGKPFLGFLWCDLWCDDDDITTTTTTSTTTLDDLMDALFDPCRGCPTSRPTTRRTPTPNPGMMQPFNIVISPSMGMNLTMSNAGIQIAPLNGGPAMMANPMATPAPTSAATTAATTAADAGNTTDAPTTEAG